MDVSPEAKLNYSPNDQTLVKASYKYGMRYYENRDANKADHSHDISASLNHKFSELYNFSVSDNFTIAQEPALLEPTGVVTTPLRSEGNNMRNLFAAEFQASLMTDFWADLGYNNTSYDYQQNGIGSRSALLDRMEQIMSLNLRRENLFERTAGILGYQYGVVSYTSNDPVAPGLSSNSRGNRSHYYYAGVNHDFTSQLMTAIRLGGQTVDYSGPGKAQTSPYADLNINYAYREGSTATLGFKYLRNQTYIGVLAGSPEATMDTQSAILYGAVVHKFTSNLKATLSGQWQESQFRGGTANSQSENFSFVGLDMEYSFNKNIAATLGYNFDILKSELDGIGGGLYSYDRNRYYIGLRASY